MKWLKRVALAVIALAIAGALAWAYRPRPTEVEVARVTMGPMRAAIEVEGRTRVHDRYVVSAPLPGQLARLEQHAGDVVREGDVLARLLPTPAPMLDPRARDEAEARLHAAQDALRQAQASVERARTALEAARRETARQRGLLAHDAVPRQVVEQLESEERALGAEVSSARFAAQVAGHAVDAARALVGRWQPHSAEGVTQQIEVTAPANGRVLRLIQQSAGVVNAGTPLLEVGDLAALEVVADVLTEDAVRVPPHAGTEVTRWGGTDTLEGHVRLVEPSAFTRVSSLGVEEQRVNVIIDLETPFEARAALGDGYRVEAAIVTWRGDVVQVPSSAVFREGDAWAMFMVENGRAVRRTIAVGHRDGRSVEIVRGARAGEVAVVHPGDTLTPGARVAVR